MLYFQRASWSIYFNCLRLLLISMWMLTMFLAASHAFLQVKRGTLNLTYILLVHRWMEDMCKESPSLALSTPLTQTWRHICKAGNVTLQCWHSPHCAGCKSCMWTVKLANRSLLTSLESSSQCSHNRCLLQTWRKLRNAVWIEKQKFESASTHRAWSSP